ncbi:MAG: TonB-dependent receptor domain-containing protein [Bacteroides cellulosilyticus]
MWSQNWEATSDKRYQGAVNGAFLPSYSLGADMANKDLKWETTITRNIGVDFGFFNSRLTGTIDAYWNTTKDLLMKTAIPGITGFTSTYANVRPDQQQRY